ncbi:MAG: response regulator [Candidatus Latescibacterota bacterium]|nr:MAG: response regulator [Candidatus Latescibacterota bacterium]
MDADAREAVEQIALATERAAALTRQLLTFSRKQVANPQNLDLNALLGNLTKMLQRILGEDVLLQVDYSVPAPLIHADAGMLEQVVMNLAVNARDAMPCGGQLRVATSVESIGADYVKLHPQARTGDFVCLAVSDTGEGIPAAIQPRIFEPFFTTKEVGKGTGLGLATVYGIVKQNNGSIDVKSKRGAGTTFTIYLPRTGEARQEPPAPAGEPTPGVETVLVVEDEPAILKLAEKVLAQYGYKVLAAKAPDAALELVRDFSGRIDLLVTDVVMPGMNGRELRDEISRMKPGLKCLFMSGYTADVIAHQGLVEEGVNFLQKPFSVASLAKRVREALDGE